MRRDVSVTEWIMHSSERTSGLVSASESERTPFFDPRPKWGVDEIRLCDNRMRRVGRSEEEQERRRRPDANLDWCHEKREVLTWSRKRAPPGNMPIPGNTQAEESMHGVPERRSNQWGGRSGVTPCVVPSPNCLATKRATLTPENHRLLAPWGCSGREMIGQWVCVFNISMTPQCSTVRRPSKEWQQKIQQEKLRPVTTTRRHSASDYSCLQEKKNKTSKGVKKFLHFHCRK